MPRLADPFVDLWGVFTPQRGPKFREELRANSRHCSLLALIDVKRQHGMTAGP